MTGFLVDVFCQEKNTFKTFGGPLVGIGMGDVKFCGDGGDDFGGGFRDDAFDIGYFFGGEDGGHDEVGKL